MPLALRPPAAVPCFEISEPGSSPVLAPPRRDRAVGAWRPPQAPGASESSDRHCPGGAHGNQGVLGALQSLPCDS